MEAAMHGRHDHPLIHSHHDLPRSHNTVSGYELSPSAGHNATPSAQWQSPHTRRDMVDQAEPDFDLIESAFAESFPAASDPTSFLRLAGVAFAGHSADGQLLKLLRVEFEQVTDVGAVTPHLGGATMRIDPLPAQLVSRRRRLSFAYQSGSGITRLSLAEARCLEGVEPENATPLAQALLDNRA
jgi:hypothetical protein